MTISPVDTAVSSANQARATMTTEDAHIKLDRIAPV
jgi:hypothetical protein